MIIFYIITAAVVFLIVLMFIFNKPEDDEIRNLKDSFNTFEYKSNASSNSLLKKAKSTIALVANLKKPAKETNAKLDANIINDRQNVGIMVGVNNSIVTEDNDNSALQNVHTLFTTNEDDEDDKEEVTSETNNPVTNITNDPVTGVTNDPITGATNDSITTGVTNEPIITDATNEPITNTTNEPVTDTTNESVTGATPNDEENNKSIGGSDITNNEELITLIELLLKSNNKIEIDNILNKYQKISSIEIELLSLNQVTDLDELFSEEKRNDIIRILKENDLASNIELFKCLYNYKYSKLSALQTGGSKTQLVVYKNNKLALLGNEDTNLLKLNKDLSCHIIEEFIENLLNFYINSNPNLLKNEKNREKEINNLEVVLNVYETKKILSQEKQMKKIYLNSIKLINILYYKTNYWKCFDCNIKSYKNIIDIIHYKYLNKELKGFVINFSIIKLDKILLFKQNLLDKLLQTNTLDIIANIKLNLYCNIVNLDNIIDTYVKIYKLVLDISNCKTHTEMKKLYKSIYILLSRIRFTYNNYKSKIANNYEQSIIKDLDLKENLLKEVRTRIKANIEVSNKNTKETTFVKERNIEKQYSEVIGLYNWFEDNKSKSTIYPYKKAIEKYFRVIVDDKINITKPNKNILLELVKEISNDNLVNLDSNKFKNTLLLSYKNSRYNNDLTYKNLKDKIIKDNKKEIIKPVGNKIEEYIKYNNKNYIIKNDKISKYIIVNNRKKYLCKVENKYNFIN